MRTELRTELRLVLVVERDLLQPLRDRELGAVGDALRLEHLLAHLRHQLGTRIVVLVHAMAEAHQPRRVRLVLRARQEVGDRVDRSDLGEHTQRRLVGAAVGGAPQRRDPRRHARERVRLRRRRDPHRRRARVLLVVGVEDEDRLERARVHRVDDVRRAPGVEGGA